MNRFKSGIAPQRFLRGRLSTVSFVTIASLDALQGSRGGLTQVPATVWLCRRRAVVDNQPALGAKARTLRAVMLRPREKRLEAVSKLRNAS